MPHPTRLAAVAAFFNAGASHNRLHNFQRFATSLDPAIDLFVIEAQFRAARPGDPVDARTLPVFETPGCYCYYGADVIWQKERLINLALAKLPARYDAIAWVDADIVWDRPDLAEATLLALRYDPVVQMWDRALFLGPDGLPQPWPKNWMGRAMAAYNLGREIADPSPSASHPGFAWAARRETLDAIGGLYDRDISGGGDSSAALAWWGDTRNSYLSRHSPGYRASVTRWARRVHKIVQGRVGVVRATIRHLYHGTIANRQYWPRAMAIGKAGYDPCKHISREPGEPLAWTPDAPAPLRELVCDYLIRGRQEDDVLCQF